MHTKLYSDNLKGRDHLRKLCRRIILKQIFKKQEEDVQWISLYQDMVQWWAVENINFWVL
jgi:hypothetical protein